MRLRKDRLDPRCLQADADGIGAWCQSGQRPVEVAAAISQPEPRRVPAHQRRKGHVRDHLRPFGGDGDLPEAVHHVAIGRPGPEHQRRGGRQDNRQGHCCALPDKICQPVPQVQFRLDRPPGRDRQALDPPEPRADQIVQPGCDPLGGVLSRRNRQRGAFRQQTRPLGLAPARHVTRLRRIDGQRVKIGRVDFMRQAGGRGIAPRTVVIAGHASSPLVSTASRARAIRASSMIAATRTAAVGRLSISETLWPA